MPARTPLAVSLLSVLFAYSPAAGQVRFVPATPMTVSTTSPSAIAVADCDGDGVDDFAITDGNADEVRYFRGMIVDGGWRDSGGGSGYRIPTGAHPVDVAAGDFDGDGFADLATADFDGGTVTLLRGSVGVPERASSVATPSAPLRLRAGDFDRDGRDDLVVTCASDIAVLRGLVGGFDVQALGVPALGSVVAADFGDENGDGRLEIGVVALRRGSAPSRPLLPSELFRYVADGTGRFFAVSRVTFDPALVDATDVASVDSDGDGLVEWVVSSAAGGVYVREATAAVARFTPTSGVVRSMAPADFDADGGLDLAVLTFSPSRILVLQSDGASGLLQGSPTGAGPLSIDLAPMRRDEDSFRDAMVLLQPVVAGAWTEIEGFRNRALPPCARGNVNAGAGAPTDVLFVNEDVGDADRVVVLAESDSLRIFMAAPPSIIVAPFALYAWLGWPAAGGPEFSIPGVGRTCFPTPLSPAAPSPVRIWNNTGRRRLGVPSRASVPAPSTVVDSPRGVPGAGARSVFLQGIIADPATNGTRGASVTNGIFLRFF